MNLSIVITTYNRGYCVSRAIKSAQNFLANNQLSEIIIVDDCSTDETIPLVEALISGHTNGPQLMLLRHKVNKGVCAAKNTGANAAIGEWIIFLDSDDELIPESYFGVYAALHKNSEYPIHFFSCIPDNESAIEKSTAVKKISFNQYISRGTGGEKLPVIRRTVFRGFPYDEDMPGYEGLSYARIIKKYDNACIYDLSVRRYYTINLDRLSARAGLWRRSGGLALGHLRMILENHREMTFFGILMYGLRIFKSTTLWALYCLKIK